MAEKSVLLAPNESVPLENLPYPLLASTKFDGNRCLIKNGSLLTRSMKPQANTRLPEYLKEIVQFSEENRIIFDGEIYSHELTFSELQTVVRTQDIEIPNHVQFHVFDVVPKELWGKCDTEFSYRLGVLKSLIERENFANVKFVPHHLVKSAYEVKELYERLLTEGFEGLMLRNPQGRYKNGRATVKENIIYKLKPFSTIDAVIIGFEQQVSVRKDIERGVDELGRTKKTHKAENFVLADNLGTLIVKDEDGREFRCGFGKGWDHGRRRELWRDKNNLIGQWVEVRYLTVGEKDLPRMPQLIRFRESK